MRHSLRYGASAPESADAVTPTGSVSAAWVAACCSRRVASSASEVLRIASTPTTTRSTTINPVSQLAEVNGDQARTTRTNTTKPIHVATQARRKPLAV